MEIIEFRKVSKVFPIKKKAKNSFSKPKQQTFLKSVDEVSFKIHSGEIVGLIGLNGSGKSTLSDLIVGITKPTSGRIERQGTASLLSINGGLKPNLTGMDNIILKCLYHGLDYKEIKPMIAKIVKFSELDRFIKQPIKTYSSGMKAKLGFSIAIHLHTEVLVIDEALAVGDQTFYQKCIDTLIKKNKEGITIILVSHSLAQIKQL